MLITICLGTNGIYIEYLYTLHIYNALGSFNTWYMVCDIYNALGSFNTWYMVCDI